MGLGEAAPGGRALEAPGADGAVVRGAECRVFLAPCYNIRMQPITAQHIELRPQKCGGRSCIAGTRIRVQDIYVWHELDGKSPIEIIGEFPELSLADVHAAIAYYFDNREQIEGDIAQEDQAYETLKAQSVSKVAQKRATTDGDPDQISS